MVFRILGMSIFRWMIVCFFLSLLHVTYAENIGTFVVLSDLHYNPKASNTHYPSAATDSNKALLDSVINHIADETTKEKSKPDFFLIIGDFLAHDFTSICPQDKKCVQDAIKYPLQSIWATQDGVFKNIPLYAALGNNDAYAGNYKLSSKDGFFGDVGTIFAKYAFPDGVPTDFLTTYKSNYGSYTATIPATCGTAITTRCKKIMVLNTVLFANKGSLLTCDNGDCTLFRKNMISYINSQITRNGIPAFVATHIPDSKSFGWDDQAQPQITEQTTLFLQCTSGHLNCVKGIFAGHVHMFVRNIQTASSPKNVPSLIAPSVTPINGATPGFLIISYDRDNGKLTQVQRFYIDNYGTTLAGKAITTSISWSHQVVQ